MPLTLDARDVRILRSLGFQPFLVWPHTPDTVKPAALAKKLGIGADTVKERIARMQRAGVIDGYEIYPNFLQLGLMATTYHFRVPEPARKSRAIQGLDAVEGVVGVYNFVGPDVCVDLAHRGPTDLGRKVKLVEAVLGVEAAPFSCFEYRPPKVPRPLTRLDWKVVRALRGNARRSLTEVAKELKVSSRTVRRHFDRMAEEGSFDIVPRIDVGRLTGYVMYELVVSFDQPLDERAQRTLEKQFDDVLCQAWPMPDPARRALTLLLIARNVGEMEDLRRRAEATPGVRSAETLLPVDSTTNESWIDEAIAERIREPNPVEAASEPIGPPRS